jgi:WD40 repeat protein
MPLPLPLPLGLPTPLPAPAGSMDSSARLWDVEGGRELQCLEGHAAEIVSVAFNTAGGRGSQPAAAGCCGCA